MAALRHRTFRVGQPGKATTAHGAADIRPTVLKIRGSQNPSRRTLSAPSLFVVLPILRNRVRCVLLLLQAETWGQSEGHPPPSLLT